MTTSPLKVEDSRPDFEAWFSSRKESMKRCGLGMIAIRRAHDAAWSAWQASRAAIVVELPETQQINEADINIPDEADWPDGFNVALEQCADVIRAAGIIVKGDSDE